MKISIQKESTRRSPHSHRTGHKRATSAAEERTLRRRRRVHFLTDVPNSVCMCAEGWMEGAAGSTRSPANGPTQLLWRVHVHWQTMYYRLGLSETESERQPPSLRPPRSYWLAPTPRRQHQHSAFDQQSALALRWNIYKYISRSACVHIYEECPSAEEWSYAPTAVWIQAAPETKRDCCTAGRTQLGSELWVLRCPYTKPAAARGARPTHI